MGTDQKSNLVCFTDFSCGGILVAILNQREVEFNNDLLGSVTSTEHNMLKSKDGWINNIDKCQPGIWYSTHLRPDEIDITMFDKVICVTTVQSSSQFIIFRRLSRFLDIRRDSTLESIDRFRELAKEYVLPRIWLPQKGCVNVELVDLLTEKSDILRYTEIQWLDWKKKNSYLYTDDSWLRDRFDEAVYETTCNKLYRYDLESNKY